jgi:FkbM family methyltransferase
VTGTADLEATLARIRDVAEGAETAFDRAAGPFRDRMVLYGAGNLGRKTCSGLRRVGVEPLAFADGDRSLHGRVVEGLPVHSPEETARSYGDSAVFVVTVWSPGSDRRFSAIRDRLTALGCGSVVWFVPLFWKHPQVFLPHYRIHEPRRIVDSFSEIRSAFDLWADDSSRREFLSQLEWLVSMEGGPAGLPPAATSPTYLPSDLFRLGPDDLLVDAGAFDGDTIRAALACHPAGFRGINAFEPDPASFERLKHSVDALPEPHRSRVWIREAALGERTGVVRFEAQGTVGSAIRESGEVEVACVSLDEELAGEVPTYLKMDIEGGEMDALRGAGRLIASVAPVLAICVYHLQEHLWQIPLFIRSLSDRYVFFLRRYVDEFGDLVCYAVPRHRLLWRETR